MWLPKLGSVAEELGLKNVTMMLGDAFDHGSLAAIKPKPTIAIVSGLYELFPANQPVSDSLRGLADAVEPGGYLVYTKSGSPGPLGTALDSFGLPAKSSLLPSENMDQFGPE